MHAFIFYLVQVKVLIVSFAIKYMVTPTHKIYTDT